MSAKGSKAKGFSCAGSRVRSWSYLGLALTLSMPVLADPGDIPTRLDDIVVIADKAPRRMGEVVGTVSSVSGEQLDQELMADLGDLFRYQAGVAVEDNSTRFGAQGVQIRGIGGNRTIIEVDGIPVSDQFDIGRFSHATRDLVPLSLIRRVDILRGPASSLYGSRALGGVISIRTRDPDELVRAGRQTAFGLGSGFDQRSDAITWNGLAAISQPRWSALAHWSGLQGHEFEHAADAPMRDQQDRSAQNGLLRLVWADPGENVLRLSAERRTQHVQTNIQSPLGTGRFRSTTRLEGDDEQSLNRVSLEYELSGPLSLADGGSARVYHQRHRTRQLTVDERMAAEPAVRNDRGFVYEQDSTGLLLNLHADWRPGLWLHQFSYGVEYRISDIRERRDATQTRLDSGAQTQTVLGETFPVRDFPVSETVELGLYLQDQFAPLSSRFWLVPALRYDRTELSPRADEIFMQDNPTTTVVALAHDAVSPKLGLLFAASPRLSLFGQYARGFRAPPFEDANIGLDIPLFNLRAIPNPALRPDRSDGFELGLRWAGSLTHLDLALFQTQYKDFIATKVNLGPDPATGVVVFQSQNIERAEVRGAELRGGVDLGAWLPGLDLEGSLIVTRGENRVTRTPLDSIEPAQAMLALDWQPGTAWQLKLALTAVERQRRIDDGVAQFIPGGYATTDLFVGWRPRRGIALHLGLTNLGNQRYWPWTQVRGLAPDDPVLPLLSAPGRSLSGALRLNF